MKIVCSELSYERESAATKSLDLYIGVFRKSIITANSVSELRASLREVNSRKFFITVHPMTIQVARWAAHDTRVDSILMTPENLEIFDKKQASIMKYYAKPLEVHLPYLVSGEDRVRGQIYRRLNLFVRRGVALVVGSASEKWGDLVPPFSLIKFLSTQYDIPEKTALLAITNIPRLLLLKKEEGFKCCMSTS